MDIKEIGTIAVAFLILLVGANYFGFLQLEGVPGGPSATTTTLAGVSCPDDGITTLNVKLWDDYAASGTYLASATFYAKNLLSGVIENNTTSSASAFATMDVECGMPYIVYATTVAGTSGSAISDTITANGNNMYVNLHTNHLGNMQIRVQDVTGDDYESLFPDAITNGVNTTAYSDLNATNVYESVAGDDIAIGDGGYLDTYIYIKAATARYWGNDKGEVAETNAEMGLQNFMCVRQGTDNEWTKDSVIVAVDDGASLPNVISSIDEDSREYAYVDNSFACYDIGDIGDTPSKIRFYIASDENPDNSNDDITLYFLSEGTYLSSDDVDTVKTGLYTDASTQVGVTYCAGEVPYLVFNIE